MFVSLNEDQTGITHPSKEKVMLQQLRRMKFVLFGYLPEIIIESSETRSKCVCVSWVSKILVSVTTVYWRYLKGPGFSK